MIERAGAAIPEEAISGNPYVGPRPFKLEDRARFFGRDREARDLLSQVISERLLLFYAPSGAGKSSLLDARLIPALQDKRVGYTILPKGRVGGELPPGVSYGDVGNIYVYNLILSLLPNTELATRLTRMRLDRFLARLRCEPGRPCEFDESAARKATKLDKIAPAGSERPRVLVVDQFEEIVTTHASRWQDREDFFRQLDEAMTKEPRLWVLLILREDYVASLDPYARLVANNLRQRNYMQRMDRAGALAAIKGPAAKAGRPFTEEAAAELARRLSLMRVEGQTDPQEGQFVEPMLLQVVCYRLWENVKDRPGDKITIDDLQRFGDVDAELMGFYEDEVRRVLSEEGELVTEQRLRDWFERHLITPPPTLTRSFIPRGDADTAGMPNEIVDALENYLLRVESRAGGRWVELIHDTFIEPIRRSNRLWREQNTDPITAGAEKWRTSDEKTFYLLQGEVLEEARARLENSPETLGETERRFVRASIAADRQRAELVALLRTAQIESHKYLSEVGWGVIFPEPPADDVEAQERIDAIRERLRPLLDHRKAEATKRRREHYREFTGPDGYRPGESARDFLDRRDVGPGQVPPSVMPYYLLIVAGPETIPFEFQYDLSTRFAVGRLHFEDLQDYRRYAESVVLAETGGATPRPHRVAYFAPKLQDDTATKMGSELLFEPLVSRLSTERTDWVHSRASGPSATKAKLTSLVAGHERPALLYAQTHGLSFSDGHERQQAESGALVCQDWLGPRIYGQPSPAMYFAGSDVPDAADVSGLVMLVYATNSAGTPQMDEFWLQTGSQRKQIAPRPFLSGLALRLLSHPAGPAHAVIGHVERPWAYLFRWQGPRSNQAGVETFAAAIGRMLEGFPVGAAMQPFWHRQAEIAAILAGRLFEHEAGTKIEHSELVRMWTAWVDARNWIIVGDPAVRLMVAGLRPDLSGLDLLYRTEDLREEGDRLAQSGDLDAARAVYQRAVELGPWLAIDPDLEASRVAARTRLREGRALAEEGKVEPAVAQLQAALGLDPALDLDPVAEASRLAAPWFAQQGARLFEQGNVAEGLGEFARAIELDPAFGVGAKEVAGRLSAPGYVRRGAKAAEEGQLAEAVALFEAALALDPALTLDPRQEAGRLAATRRVEQARKLAQDGHTGKAMAEFRTALKLDPALELDPKAETGRLAAPHHVGLGREAAARGEVDVALRAFKRARSLDPSLQLDARAEAGRLAAPFLVQQARQLAAEGRVAEAEERFREALRLDRALKLDLAAELNRTATALPGAGLKSKLWQPGRVLRVAFMDGEADQRHRVAEKAAEWTEYANIRLEFGEARNAEIRVTFDEPGGWSYLGTDALAVAKDRATVGLGALKEASSPEWGNATILRVFGYVLGLIREHQNPNTTLQWNRDAIYAEYEGAPNHWPRSQIDAYFFTRYPPDQMAVVKPFDPLSIMMPEIPARFTLDGFSTGVNLVLSEKDKESVARLYPRVESAPAPASEVAGLPPS